MFRLRSPRLLPMAILLAACQVALSLTAAVHHDHVLEEASSGDDAATGWCSEPAGSADDLEYAPNSSCRLCNWSRTVYRPAPVSQIRTQVFATKATPASISVRPSRSASARHVLLRAPPLS